MKGEFLSIETAGKIAKLEKENKELKDKIDKAIEYINISLRDSFENDKYPLNGEDFEHLLNILESKGE